MKGKGFRLGLSANYQYRPQAPCLNCEDRYVGCHSKCKKYLDYQDKLAEFKKRRDEEKPIMHWSPEGEKKKQTRMYQGKFSKFGRRHGK